MAGLNKMDSNEFENQILDDKDTYTKEQEDKVSYTEGADRVSTEDKHQAMNPVSFMIQKSNQKLQINKIILYVFLLSLSMFCIMFSIFFGYYIYQGIVKAQMFSESYNTEEDSMFNNTVAIVKKADSIQNFLDKNDIFGLRKDLTEEEIINMYLLRRYDDDYLEYYTPKEMMEAQKGDMSGIGVTITETGKYCRIKEIAPGSPADKAGLHVDDVIVRFNDTELGDSPVEDLTNRLKAVKGDTSFTLTYYRAGMYNTVTLKKEKILVTRVYKALLDGEIPYIRVTSFSSLGTANQFETAIKELLPKITSTKTLVFDLRDNGGGLATEAIDIIGNFVGKNKLALIIGKKEGEPDKFKTRTEQLIPDDTKIYILTNYGTASASELTITSLMDYGKDIKVIGERTYGKGIAQDIVEVPWGGYLKYTQGLYYSAFGTNIHEKGIKPDVLVFGKDEQNEMLCSMLGIDYNAADFLS